MLAVAFLGNAVACVGRLRRHLMHSTVVAFHARREQEVHSIDQSRELAHVLDSGQLGRLRRRRSWHELCHSRVARDVYIRKCYGLSTLRLVYIRKCSALVSTAARAFGHNENVEQIPHACSSHTRPFSTWFSSTRSLPAVVATGLRCGTSLPVSLISECAHGCSQSAWSWHLAGHFR